MYLSSFFVFTLILVLVNVAFITLMERKILGLSQLRKGPSKVGFAGILQPVSDAIKLFLKESTAPFKSNKMLFGLSPCLGFILSMLLWSVVPMGNSTLSMWVSSILLVTILGFGVYPLLLSGWASNSKYAMVGALRGVAQTISYEISLALIVFTLLLISSSLKLLDLSNFNNEVVIGVILPAMTMLWLISCVAETNRTPFDFSEGESELVSGFNVEYGSGGFTLIFMAEYSMILFFSLVSSLIMVYSPDAKLLSVAAMVVVSFFWVWLRATFPRHRYDKLMNLSWKTVLPLTLVNLVWTVALVAYH